LEIGVEDNESSFIHKKNLRQVQNHPPQRQDDGDLLEPQAQAAARIVGTEAAGLPAAGVQIS
jgi:hypothetical protein